jgi:hypothetical protein
MKGMHVTRATIFGQMTGCSPGVGSKVTSEQDVAVHSKDAVETLSGPPHQAVLWENCHNEEERAQSSNIHPISLGARSTENKDSLLPP